MLIYLILLLITSECRDMIKYTFIFTIFSFAVAPLIFWILQNIIALVTSIFAIIIMCGLLYLGMRLFLAGGAEEGESLYSGSDDESRLKRDYEQSKESAELYRKCTEAEYASAIEGDGFLRTAEEKIKKADRYRTIANSYEEQATYDAEKLDSLRSNRRKY